METPDYTPAQTLDGYAADVRMHADAFDDTVDSERMDHLRPHLLRMRQAVTDAFGPETAIIGGEQSIFPLPKNLGKLMALQVLSQHYGMRSINLRAPLDIARSEVDIRRVDLPSYGSESGMDSFNLLSTKMVGSRKGVMTIQGFPLPDQKLADNAKRFVGLMQQQYPGSFRNGNTNETNLDQAVLADFMACYGMDLDGNRLDAMPDHIQELALCPDVNGIPQMDIVLPDNLAQAHENWFIMLQRRLGVDSEITVSEEVIDRMLLKSGGHEVLSEIMTASRRKLRESGYDPVAMNLSEERDLQTWFNMSKDGIRYGTFFTDDSYSQISVYNPETKEVEETVSVDDVLADDSEWSLSLRAVERVTLYSLAGLGGHITGGGSVYNADARAVLGAMDIPYYPIWSFSKTDEDGNKITPVQYMSMALNSGFGTEFSRNPDLIQARLHMQGILTTLTGQALDNFEQSRAMLEEEETMGKSIDNILRPTMLNALTALRGGKVSLFDLAMSVPMDLAAEEIAAFIEQNGGNISRTSAVSLTNRAGLRLSDFDAVKNY